MASVPNTSNKPDAAPASPQFLRLPGQGPLEELAQFGNAVWNCQPIAQQTLTGAPEERWLAPGPVQHARVGRFQVARSKHYLFACAEVPIELREMRSQTAQVYRELMALVRGSRYPQLLRFWNYVPQINRGEGDEELYRQFCWGRAEALSLEDSALPAATAIGCKDPTLRISVLTATPTISVVHLENPRQVSAYHYPRQYGPRSPSFARATRVTCGDQSLLLLSGTASIVSHETRHPGDLGAQLQETQRNIASLLAVAAEGREARPELLRVYLRNPKDLNAALDHFSAAFPGYEPPAVVQGDICREPLVVEIDGAFALTEAA